MKLDFEIDGRTLAADFEARDGEARLVLAEESRQAQILEPEPMFYTILLNDRVFNCAIETSPTGALEVIVNGRRIPVIVRDKKRMRGPGSAAGGADGRAAILSPMPGKVVRLLVQPGDDVALHQGVLVVEAMKMQNEVQAPKAGLVAEIKVTEGQTVNAGDLLAVIE